MSTVHTHGMALDPQIDLCIESDLWSALPDAEQWVETAIKATLEHVDIHLFPQVEVAVQLVDDAQIQELNAEWRGKNKPTNVLSFQSVTPERLATAPLLGDLVIAFETMSREAVEEQKKPENHFAHLVVHGTLHLLGFDHENETDAEIMENLERAILAKLDIPDPYSGELERSSLL